jgi:hypothetical protein
MALGDEVKTSLFMLGLSSALRVVIRRDVASVSIIESVQGQDRVKVR